MTVSFPSVSEQLEYLKKGFLEIIREEELKERLEQSVKTGRPLTCDGLTGDAESSS